MRSRLLAALVGTGLAAAACGSGRHLDMTDLRTRLEAEMRSRVAGARQVQAECPPSASVRLGTGISFRCTVAVDGRRLLVTLTQTDGAGHVSTAVDG
jgi:Domain of unknown function (DUF4333)